MLARFVLFISLSSSREFIHFWRVLALEPSFTRSTWRAILTTRFLRLPAATAPLPFLVSRPAAVALSPGSASVLSQRQAAEKASRPGRNCLRGSAAREKGVSPWLSRLEITDRTQFLSALWYSGRGSLQTIPHPGQLVGSRDSLLVRAPNS